ncbi:hypothetical protein FRC12_024087 [Ceratobasidium sp. 428]|nr:hypothetical protein FRC12_024087 [Ceratobasidium sp. 428]
MLEEFEVEGLLGSGTPSQNSLQSLSRASSLSQSQDLLGYCPPPATSVDHLRGFSFYQTSAVPLSRQQSAASTVLELPDGPGGAFPSYGALSELSGSSSESSIDETKINGTGWTNLTPLPKLTTRSLMTFRSFGGESEGDSDHASVEESGTPYPLTFPSGGHGSTDTLSSSSSSSPVTDGLVTPVDRERKRIWEIPADYYVPRPLGLRPQGNDSVCEIGMQWERAHANDSPHTRAAKLGMLGKLGMIDEGAVGEIRRIHGDAQYLN